MDSLKRSASGCVCCLLIMIAICRSVIPWIENAEITTAIKSLYSSIGWAMYRRS